MGLLDWFFGNGGGERDGTAAEKAIVVRSVEEEYRWMQRHYPGFMPQCQALTDIDGKPFDVLTWRNESGEEVTVYFDISRFYGS
jgi:hypothetical protein